MQVVSFNDNEFPAVCTSIEELDTLAIAATKETIIQHSAGAYRSPTIKLAPEQK